MSTAYDIVAIDGIELDTIIGIYPDERVRRQRLRLDVEVYLTAKPARGAELTGFIDYARLSGDLRFILEHANFELLESALEAMAAHCLGAPTSDTPRPPVERVRLSVQKPFALEGKGIPRVVIDRIAGSSSQMLSDVQTIFEGDGCGVYRFAIAPRSSATFVMPDGASTHDLMLGADLIANDEKLARGEMHTLDGACAVTYVNPGDIIQTVLRVCRPAHLPTPCESISAPKRPPSGRRLYYPVVDIA